MLWVLAPNARNILPASNFHTSPTFKHLSVTSPMVRSEFITHLSINGHHAYNACFLCVLLRVLVTPPSVLSQVRLKPRSPSMGLMSCPTPCWMGKSTFLTSALHCTSCGSAVLLQYLARALEQIISLLFDLWRMYVSHISCYRFQSVQADLTKNHPLEYSERNVSLSLFSCL